MNMMFTFVFLLYISSCLLSSVIGGKINFSSFIEGNEYSYYTNSYNRITELTCNANSTNEDVTSIITTWFYDDTDGSINTGNNILKFQDVANVVGLRESRQYYCRADYSENGQNLYEDSRAIGVYIDYKIKVSVKYTTTSQVIEIPQETPQLIPVMTEIVMLSCDAGTTVEWSYQPKSKTGQNPLTLDRLTIELGGVFYFKDINSPNKVYGNVYIQPFGSGVWLQQQDDYIQLSDREEIILTENRTLVCVSSLTTQGNNWYFSGEDAAEERTQVSDMIERDESKGFVKLTLPTGLPTNRAGYYHCTARELSDKGKIRIKNHSIKIAVPNNPTTTPTSTTTSPVVSTTTAEINSTKVTFAYTSIAAAVVAVVVIVLLLGVIVLVVLSCVFLKKRNKSGYKQQVDYVNHEKEIHIEQPTQVESPNNSFKSYHLPITTKKPNFQSPFSSHQGYFPVEKGGYVNLGDLRGNADRVWKDNDSGLEDTYSHNETQYENARETLYQSTNRKYFNDPNGTLVPIATYKDHLNHLLCEFRMEGEYRALGGQELRYECDAAKQNINSYRNKYKMIYPYDESRVVLTSQTDSDYINASLIPGFHVSDTFIASQAPKMNTVGDFWQMISEQQVTTIVMLTRVVELGKEKSIMYWPQEPGTSMTYWRVNVVLQKEEKFTGYTKRKFLMTGPGSRNTFLTQFHYTAWPDHDVPQLYDNLLCFTEMVKHHRKHERAPLLVHCSAGVGRSGTFISLYNLLEAVKVGEQFSVYRIVNEMREYRPQMVQTFNQYKFLYLSILELIFGSTAVPSADFCENYKLYQLSQTDNDVDIFEEQFQELTYQSEFSLNYPQTCALDPSNADRNVIKDVLPYDNNRVILYSPKWSCEYINASYMEGYKIMATPLPSYHTIEDYLQLIYQLEDPLVVLLLTQDEFSRMGSGSSDRVCYWLDKPGVKKFGNFIVKTEKSQKSTSLLRQKLKVFSNYEDDEHPFTQYTSLESWNEEGKVTDVIAILDLLDLIFQQEQTSPDKRILFCCSDGIGKSGVLLTAYKAIRGIQSTQSVDVFQSVKHLRNSRKNMVPALGHYLSCYDVINGYCQMNV